MSLETTLDALAPRLLRFCLGLAGDPSLAEEAAQDALTALVQRWRRHGPPEAADAFAFAIARRRLARRRGRQRARARQTASLELVAETPSDSPGPEARATTQQALLATLGALDQLKNRLDRALDPDQIVHLSATYENGEQAADALCSQVDCGWHLDGRTLVVRPRVPLLASGAPVGSRAPGIPFGKRGHVVLPLIARCGSPVIDESLAVLEPITLPLEAPWRGSGLGAEVVLRPIASGRQQPTPQPSGGTGCFPHATERIQVTFPDLDRQALSLEASPGAYLLVTPPPRAPDDVPSPSVAVVVLGPNSVGDWSVGLVRPGDDEHPPTIERIDLHAETAFETLLSNAGQHRLSIRVVVKR